MLDGARGLWLAAAAVGGVTLGTMAGFDAGSRVDGIYRTAPGTRYPRLVAAPTGYRDWAESATYPMSSIQALPPTMMPAQAMRFDDGFTDEPPPRVERVRVHRAAIQTVEEVDPPLPDIAEPDRDDAPAAVTDDEAQDPPA